MNRVLAFSALVLTWLALTGDVSSHTLLPAALLSLLTLFLLRNCLIASGPRLRPFAIAVLVLVFLKALVLSVIAVTRLVLRPRLSLTPAIVAVPMTLESEFSRVLLANLITLTPGTLSVDFSGDGKVLYVHALDCPDPDALRREIALGFERRIREAFA